MQFYNKWLYWSYLNKVFWSATLTSKKANINDIKSFKRLHLFTVKKKISKNSLGQNLNTTNFPHDEKFLRQKLFAE